MTIEQLFFELIRVSIGTQDTLSRAPSAEEWNQLYQMAKKQSLIGICFAGVQRLNSLSPSLLSQLPEVVYLRWMGMAAKIQQRNEVVTNQCKSLLEKMAKDGVSCRLLKGQGVAAFYNENLRLLRQSGDIDVWIVPDDNTSEDKHLYKVMQYVNGIADSKEFNRQHVQMPIYNDIEVEVHFMPSRMNNPWRNERLQRFCRVKGKEYMEKDGLVMPTAEFNVVYLLQHCYNHLLFEGVGLRQIMDYYFVLKELDKKGFAKKAVLTKTEKTAAASAESLNEPLSNVCSAEIVSKLPSSAEQSLETLSGSADTSAKNIKNIHEILRSLGLQKFASAMMSVLKEVFGLEEQYMICEPNEKEGRFLLNEIMTGGNFGKYGKDGVMEGHAKGKVAFFMARMKRNWRFLTHYPSEIIWSPYAMLIHWMWKRNVKI